jgi:hypothetical protein
VKQSGCQKTVFFGSLPVCMRGNAISSFIGCGFPRFSLDISQFACIFRVTF